MQRNVHSVLADDDPDDCFIFSSLSKEVSEKITTTCLGDCRALLKYLETNKAPDIIFLDLNMPVLSGQDCLKKIKEPPEWKKIPIVIYSTASRMDIIDHCHLLGASLYIVKPNDTNRLKQLIDSTLKQLLNLD